MKIHLVSLLLLFFTLSLPAQPPNVVLIFPDDLGYNDLSCFGSKKIKTPHLDKLAADGKRFTNFLVAAPNCTASRAALLTACYPKRINMNQGVLYPQSKKGLNPDEHSMAKHFKQAGYATAAIGKWHLGHYPETLPRAHGFDSYFGIPYSNDMNHPGKKRGEKISSDDLWLDQNTAVTYWNTPLVRNEELIELPVDQRLITRRYTDEALKFIDENKDKPFFLYLPHSMPHVPLYVPEDVYDPDPENAYTNTIQHLDAEIGRLIDRIQNSDLADNTYIIFASDNGPWLSYKNHGGSALPLRAGKGTSFEGGHRVPFIIWGPKIKANTLSNQLISSMDLLPTLASLTGTNFKAKHKIDGFDVSQVIIADEATPRHDFLYYSANGSLSGIQVNSWKLLRDHIRGAKGPLLFNLAEDHTEKTNLAGKHPEKMAELSARLDELDKEITQNRRPAWTTNKKHPWPTSLNSTQAPD